MAITTGTTDPSDPKTPTNQSDPQPPAVDVAEVLLVGRLNNLIKQARSAKEPVERDWKRWREMYEGEQWQDKPDRPSWRVSNVINVSFANVETATAVVMAMVPKLIATPATDEAVDLAGRLTHALDYHWKNLKMRKTVKTTVKDSLMYGSGIFKVTWNPDAGELEDETTWDEDTKAVVKTGKQVPVGELSVKRVSPFRVDPDPLCLDLDSAAYVIERRDVDIDYIRRRWPEKANLIKATEAGQPQLDKVWSSSPTISDPGHDSGYSRNDQSPNVLATMRPQVKLYEIWVRNLGLLYDPQDTVNWKKVYDEAPYGRVIIMAGDVILMNEPNVFADGKFPYVKYDNVDRPDMFWGKSEIEPIEPLQKEVNKRSSQIMESANLTADPKILIPRSSGLKKEKITTKPGEKIPYMGNQKPEYMVPPSLPAYAIQNLDRSMDYVDKISGNYGILSGNVTGTSSAAALSTIKEMAEMKPRMKMENLADGLREVGELMVSRMKQYYDKPRQIAITKGDGSEGIEFDQIESSDIKDSYNIDIGVGSNLPTSTSLMFQWVMSLHEIGAIKDPNDMMMLIDLPHRDQIAAHNKAIDDQQHQQQMELAQAGPQGGPPPGAAGPQGPPPPGPFSMREGPQQQGPPPNMPPMPPEGLPPEMASLISQYLEAQKNGEGGDPNIDALLGHLGGGK